MDLYAGFPYWLVKNPLFNHVHELEKDISIDVAIIGSGITGALVAHELCSHGFKCAIFDKRSIGTGSSAASTAQLQYEIDVPLHQLLKKVTERTAVTAYRGCLQSITDLENVFKKTKVDAEFERRSSLYVASDKKGLKEIEKEYDARIKYGLPVEYMSQEDLKDTYNIDRKGGLYNNVSGQLDAYKAASGLIRHHHEKNGLDLFPYTEIEKHQPTSDGYELITTSGKVIKCKFLVVAAGFEAGTFLPKKVMNLLSTYALVSEPMRKDELWHEESLIWETARPYFYLRTTNDNRIMIGGEDIKFKNEKLRDALLQRKTDKLLATFKTLFADIELKCEMAWCGTFSETKDGLPYIGEYPGYPNMLFALGYGGNGITFSMIAAQIILNKLKGKEDEREKVYGFERK